MWESLTTIALAVLVAAEDFTVAPELPLAVPAEGIGAPLRLFIEESHLVTEGSPTRRLLPITVTDAIRPR